MANEILAKFRRTAKQCNSSWCGSASDAIELQFVLAHSCTHTDTHTHTFTYIYIEWAPLMATLAASSACPQAMASFGFTLLQELAPLECFRLKLWATSRTKCECESKGERQGGRQMMGEGRERQWARVLAVSQLSVATKADTSCNKRQQRMQRERKRETTRQQQIKWEGEEGGLGTGDQQTAALSGPEPRPLHLH